MRAYLLAERFAGLPSAIWDFLDEHNVALWRVREELPPALITAMYERFGKELEDCPPWRRDQISFWDYYIGKDEEAPVALAHFVADAADFKSEVENLPFAELKQKYDAAKEAEAEREVARLKVEELSRPFHQIAANADFAFWGRLDGFTIEEATALTFARDPSAVNLESLTSAIHEGLPFAREFKRRHLQIQRAVETGALSSPIARGHLARWALQNIPQADEAFREWATSEKQPMEDSVEEKHGGPSRTTLYKLILGMAMDKYEFDPNYAPDVGSRSFQAIVDGLAAATIGISIDADTVRKAIVAANELVHEKDLRKATVRRILKPNSVPNSPNR